MPALLLRPNVVVKSSPDEFLVILPMSDGYELQVGFVSKQTDVQKRAYWQWSCPGGHGKAPTKAAAQAAIKATWNATDGMLADLRRQQEHTEWKYALWDAGYRDKMGKGPLRCRCGEMFDSDDHEAVREHIGHMPRNRS